VITFKTISTGDDLRAAHLREEVFLRFWFFHLVLKAHPGCVYYVMPHLRKIYGWDDEQALWYAWLNGNTQNPITSLALFEHAPAGPTDEPGVERMLRFYDREFKRLAWDTDRRHWKSKLRPAVAAYQEALRSHCGNQARMWEVAASDGFAGVWAQATALYGFGRLSAFSFAEYLRIMGHGAPCDNLFLGDHDGSRSHRNGLALVAGRTDLIRDSRMYPGRVDERLTAADLGLLQHKANELVAAMEGRVAGLPWEQQKLIAPDVGYFTLESALCTYKSWHKRNRRYPNVYNDMLYDRLKWYEARWPVNRTQQWTRPIWEARAASLPEWARLEQRPFDPGLSPVKQNHYLDTGQTVMMGHYWPALWSDLDDAIMLGDLGLRADVRPEKRRAL
jgi:amino acid-DNA transferase-like protein